MFPLDIRKSFLLISSKEEAIISGESSVHLKSIEPLQKATHLANLVTNAHCGREPVSQFSPRRGWSVQTQLQIRSIETARGGLVKVKEGQDRRGFRSYYTRRNTKKILK